MPTHRTNECHKYKTWRSVDVVASVVVVDEEADDIIVFLLLLRCLYRREKSEEFPHFFFALTRFSKCLSRDDNFSR